MTITLHWWDIPILLVALACTLPMLLKSHGDYDMVTSLLKGGIFLLCVGMALAFSLARLFS